MTNLAKRADLTSNPTAKKIFATMARKQSNLAVAADVTTKAELLTLAEKVGPEVCIFKTHIDIVSDFDQDLVTQLQQLAEQHDFVIFEDRKFADIGNTVKHQYQDGVYHIADWASLVNGHTLPGAGLVEGLKAVGSAKGNAMLLIAELSCKGNLINQDYTAQTLSLAEQHDDFVIGFICQQRISDDPKFIHMTPGIKMVEGGDNLGQQYNTPQTAIERGTDVIIVGRDIYQADDPAQVAKAYRKAGWEAFSAVTA